MHAVVKSLFEVLVEERREIMLLTEEIRREKNRAIAERRLPRLCSLFEVHSLAEEESVYAALLMVGQTEIVDKCIENHNRIAEHFDLLFTIKADDIHWETNLAELEDDLRVHFEMEEESVFTLLRNHFGDAMLRPICETYVRLREIFSHQAA